MKLRLSLKKDQRFGFNYTRSERTIFSTCGTCLSFNLDKHCNYESHYLLLTRDFPFSREIMVFSGSRICLPIKIHGRRFTVAQTYTDVLHIFLLSRSEPFLKNRHATILILFPPIYRFSREDLCRDCTSCGHCMKLHQTNIVTCHRE